MTYFFGGVREYGLTATLENKAHYRGEIMRSSEYTVLVTLHTLHNTVSYNNLSLTGGTLIKQSKDPQKMSVKCHLEVPTL